MSWTPLMLRRVADALRRRAGYECPPHRERQLVQALDALAMDRGQIAPDALVESVGQDPAVARALAERLAIHESYFGRGVRQLLRLGERLLPELSLRRPLAHHWKVWCAGCASGEEAFTLAILFAEHGLGRHVTISASDLSTAAIERARTGHYRGCSLRACTADYLDRHFVREPNGSFRVREVYRNAVRFHVHNLQDGPLAVAEFDLVLCRNVLIYASPETLPRISRSLYASIADGGWLLTAAADPPLQQFAPFADALIDGGMFYQRHENTAAGRNACAGAHSSLERVPTEPAPHAQIDPSVALEEALTATPEDPTLHFRHAMLLLERGRLEPAQEALRRAIYLDRQLVIAHYFLAVVAEARGQLALAERSYRNTLRLTAELPANVRLPLCESESAAELRRAAEAHITALEALR